MEIVKINQVEKTPLNDTIFTGSDVFFQELIPRSDDFLINIVHFGVGVRNKLHFHTTEQILIVTAGTGIVATETEEQIVTVGDVIRIPAGERHWHGATADNEFSHLYVMLKESKLTQVET